MNEYWMMFGLGLLFGITIGVALGATLVKNKIRALSNEHTKG
jgi:uncharacterized membrane-anchored protein YhcB (DUF1043 family)